VSWFDLGKYTPYIWTSYGIAAVVLVSNVMLAIRHARRTRERLSDYYKLKGDRS